MKSLNAKIIALAALVLALVATPALAQRLHWPAAGYVATQSVPAEHYLNGGQDVDLNCPVTHTPGNRQGSRTPLPLRTN